MENNDFGFLLFSATNISKIASHPQIVIHILICYNDICCSQSLFVLAILKQYWDLQISW